MSSLLPPGSSLYERNAALAGSGISSLGVPLRDLWNPQTCPVIFLPYLAWAFSVDRWDEKWSEAKKRQIVASSMFIHRHKGTVGALRRVVESLGFSLSIDEWWQTGGEPGTFHLDIGVKDVGITDELYQELDRLIGDTKPASRHMSGLNLTLDSTGAAPVGVACYLGEELVVYPYFPETITASASPLVASGIHIIDTMRVNDGS
ncbi:phage tail protein I [Erwinia sp. Leaf53]|uniref:phage tail protein I n=1 Tax=Erwinia sp. Leaf53 TaxID=1736225 RepID=UPI0006FD1841|nr:phage tail protein I [Erwinia sp. Leaf53]KQN58002.1 phage tail protein [Erwinia sp. Leaf53]